MLAMAILIPNGLGRVSLKACCDFLGISNDGQHNAYDDCLRTKLVYERMLEKIRWGDAGPEQTSFW
jgi:DNA polymerase III epsilon subunit-like protein